MSFSARMNRAGHALAVAGAAVVIMAVLSLGSFDRRDDVPAESESAVNPEKKEARLLFVGDMMFDRTIRAYATEEGYDHLFSCVADYLAGFDAVIGNLEGPITPGPSTSLGTLPGQPGNTSFTFAPETAAALARHNVKFVSLGNNHILDKGVAGIASTVSALDEAGVRWFGAPGRGLTATSTVGGIKLALVAFNQFVGENDPVRAARAVEAFRGQSDLVIAYAHWGDEYEPANEYQKQVARQLVDAGADLVVGSHPHVIQESENYSGGQIYYSLGNFIFDQYWNETVRRGGGLEVTWKDDAVSVTPVNFDVRRGGTVCLSE